MDSCKTCGWADWYDGIKDLGTCYAELPPWVEIGESWDKDRPNHIKWKRPYTDCPLFKKETKKEED